METDQRMDNWKQREITADTDASRLGRTDEGLMW